MCLLVMEQARLWLFRVMMSATGSLLSNLILPIIEVVQGGDVTEEAYAGDGAHVNSGFLEWFEQ